MTGPSRAESPRYALLLTCEHAGNHIPREYVSLFAGAKDVLASHRGWDPGALEFTRSLSRSFRTPFHHLLWSRLLVESNRAPSNQRIWSRYTTHLPPDEKRRILDRYWWPHRREVEAAVRAGLERARTVFHVAVHSFTNHLDGERNADIGLLYDPRRAEKGLCVGWETILNELDPTLRVRRNYPYRGMADGLPTWLRRKFPDSAYLGVELEFNQALIGTPLWAKTKRTVADSMRRLMTPGPGGQTTWPPRPTPRTGSRTKS
jgi:predicted N-formylglutamate amidohydrolase